MIKRNTTVTINEATEPTFEELAEIEIEQADFNIPFADDSLKMFLHEISQYKLLTREEENVLAHTIADGKAASKRMESIQESGEIKELNTSEIEKIEIAIKRGEKAKEMLFNHNLRLIIFVAKKYCWSEMDIQDLIQEGSFGLLQAIDKYDIEKGFKFSTYATWWIRQTICRSISNKGSNIRIPVYMGELKKRVNNAIDTLYLETNRTPTESEIADFLGIEVSKVKEVMDVTISTISIDKKVGDDEKSTIADTISDNGATNPEKIFEHSELKEILSEVIESVLNEKEAITIRMRFGLIDGEICTLEEVGATINVTRQRVKQIEQKALKKLKESKYKEILLDFMR